MVFESELLTDLDGVGVLEKKPVVGKSMGLSPYILKEDQHHRPILVHHRPPRDDGPSLHRAGAEHHNPE